jgi:hypothetical protein
MRRGAALLLLVASARSTTDAGEHTCLTATPSVKTGFIAPFDIFNKKTVH